MTSRWCLENVSDADLVLGLAVSAGEERECEAQTIAHVGEMDRRKLFRERGYPSMHAYLVGAMHFSEAAAFNRIAVGRTALRHPRVLDRPDVATRVTKVPGEGASSQLFPGPVTDGTSASVAPARVEPLAPRRYALQVTISQEVHDKLRRAQDLPVGARYRARPSPAHTASHRARLNANLPQQPYVGRTMITRANRG